MGKKNSVLILTNHSYMLYQFRHELIEQLLKEENVILGMPFVGSEELFENMGCKCIETKIERRGINPITDLKLFQSYFHLLRKEQPAYVITYSIKPNIYGGMACRLLGIRYYMNITGLGTAFEDRKLERIVTALYKMSAKKVKKIFFENEQNRNEIVKRNIIGMDRTVCLPGAGVNLNYYSYIEYPKNKKFHFLYIGRIMEEKGISELFEAIKMLNNKYKNSTILDMIGFFEDEYKMQVKQLENLGIVKFYGFQKETRPYYGLSDCVVLPSYHEGMSNVILEAAACGRPVIASNISGCRESIEDGITGLLCEKKDVLSLFECMEKMIQMNIEERKNMGIAGREKMNREYDKKHVVEKTLMEIRGI